ncbi:hypothetical protein ACFPM0_18630 [Pseudonocardia sulfidoxydans]|uniref:hypothetical protein n=1 Tax=Pseudonocardia sulfidoxydans TaxID=54011 RepID=UPI00361DC8A6
MAQSSRVVRPFGPGGLGRTDLPTGPRTRSGPPTGWEWRPRRALFVGGRSWCGRSATERDRSGRTRSVGRGGGAGEVVTRAGVAARATTGAAGEPGDPWGARGRPVRRIEPSGAGTRADRNVRSGQGRRGAPPGVRRGRASASGSDAGTGVPGKGEPGDRLSADGRQDTRPRRKPCATAWARSRTPSLRNSRRAWVLTVSSDR